MEWQEFGGNIQVTGKDVEVRSLRMPDRLDNFRRYRVTTTWDARQPKFTRTPARGRLARDGQGRIGAAVTGVGGGFLKVGRFPQCPVFLFVPLSSLSKRPRQRLLAKKSLDFFTEGEHLFARETE